VFNAGGLAQLNFGDIDCGGMSALAAILISLSKQVAGRLDRLRAP